MTCEDGCQFTLRYSRPSIHFVKERVYQCRLPGCKRKLYTHEVTIEELNRLLEIAGDPRRCSPGDRGGLTRGHLYDRSDAEMAPPAIALDTGLYEEGSPHGITSGVVVRTRRRVRNARLPALRPRGQGKRITYKDEDKNTDLLPREKPWQHETK